MRAPPPGRSATRAFTAIIPVKPLRAAKSRLDVSAAHRRALAEAFAFDVIAAAMSAREVGRLLLVTGDDETERRLAAAGVRVLRESPEAAPGLNSALRQGALWAGRHHPEDPAVVLTADLPTLTPDTLDVALAALRHHQSAFVPDRSGTGTTMLSANRPGLLRPRFGVGSARAHRATGAREVAEVDPRVRHDVDTTADLTSAVPLGLGERTRTVWRTSADPSSGPAPAGTPLNDAMETTDA